MLLVCRGLGRRCVAARFVSFRLLFSYCRLSVFEHIFNCRQRFIPFRLSLSLRLERFFFPGGRRDVFLSLGLTGNFSSFFNGFLSLDPISLTDIALELTCRFQVNYFPSTPACFRSPTNSTGRSIVELFVDFCSLLKCIR